MTDQAASSEYNPVVADERPELLIFCGALGIFGNLAMTVGTITMGLVLPGHDPISDTISDLARGEYHVIMDTIFYLNAAALIALAIGAAHAHLGRWAWSLGLLILALTALDVVMLGLWDEFGATAEGEGWSVHVKLSTLLWPLFFIGPLAMAPAAGRIRPLYKWLFIASGVSWAIAAPAFFMSPDNIDGLIERIAGVCTLFWTVTLGWMQLHRGLYKLRH